MYQHVWEVHNLPICRWCPGIVVGGSEHYREAHPDDPGHYHIEKPTSKILPTKR